MMTLNVKAKLGIGLAIALLLAAVGTVDVHADVHRGLWVGQATLNFANEVPIALDEDNVPIAPDPNIPTFTADQAHLRLILHVNGAGQVSLLKDVAVLNRADGSADSGASPTLRSESDLALVTDERLYGEVPPQPAIRIASVAFDFGDSRASEAVLAVIDASTVAAANSVTSTTENLNTSAGRVAAQAAAAQAALAVAAPIVQNADVAATFDAFLRNDFTSSEVNDLIDSGDPDGLAGAIGDPTSFRGLAEAVRTNAFYNDTRALDMVNAVVTAITNALPEEKTNAAHNAASSFADVEDSYHRFIAGKIFGDMLTAAADAAAPAAVASGATEATIRAAVDATNPVSVARSEALSVKVQQYDDTRSTDAVELVVDAIIAEAFTFLSVTNPLASTVQTAAEAAGREALESQVARFEVSARVPTLDYNEFITSAAFLSSAETAAEAAATAAVSERRNNALFTLTSIQDAVKVGAVEALDSVLSAAARAVRTELPMEGSFGPGLGDPRITATLTLGEPLGDPALVGTIFLPANHPTNPFRHRRHPDHTVGLDITRNIRLDFDGNPTNDLDRVGFGVERITGVYREEILGLHKPLGPDPDNAPIGLKVEGRFELNRISLIDSLNAL